jgi:VanZ family protein
VEDFLNGVGAFVDWSVRQWAHVFEFLIIGICVSIFYAFAMKNIWLMLVLALVTCMGISLCDQSVRIFIAGRHFDSFDLVLDALGYVSVIVVVSICRGIHRLVVNRK